MAKKIIKKRKIKVFNFLLVLCILIGLVFGVYLSLQIRIKTILIRNTNYLNDDYILELANIKYYPKYFLTSSNEIKKRLEKSDYISKVTVKKKYNFEIEIDIKENRPLFYNMNKNKYVLENKKEVKSSPNNYYFRVPRLINYVPDKKYIKFQEGMSNIKNDTLSKISDIEYQPNDYDKDRFLLYMDDGNMVYLTLTKFRMINHYNEVLTQLEGHKGILYLDSGNHFQIKE